MWVGAREYYRTQPKEFIDHWAVTYDPRNAGGDVPATLPFILFNRQKNLVDFLMACLEGNEAGLVEKCRDMGATWVCAAFSVWLWLYWPGVSVGWGSRKETLVDKLGDPDSIFEKMRIIVRGLPRELLPVGLTKDHMTHMKLINPESGSSITGEAGDSIGRGGRKRIYFKDESAHYERPESIEASLGDNTNVQIDISSVNGLGNVFHRKREGGTEWTPGAPVVSGSANVFIMDWRDHPAKNQDWFDARKRSAESSGLTHIFEQEVNRNYAASVTGVIIPFEWVRSAIDAHVTLGFTDLGGSTGGLDVADSETGDRNALAVRKGVILKHVEDWYERDTGNTTRRAVGGCNGMGQVSLQYDCIGVGSGVKAEANRLIDEGIMPSGISFVAWNAGAGCLNPDDPVNPDDLFDNGDQNPILNKDFYSNLKAQGWWQLRLRFERTWRAINDPTFNWIPDDLISISSEIPQIRQLEKELSQATYGQGTRLRMVVNKTPEGTRSPNLADAVVMAFWPVDSGADLDVWSKLAG